MTLTAFGAVTGWAALHWMGGRWFGGTRCDGELRPVPLVTGDAGIRPAPGRILSEERLLAPDIIVVDGLRVTTPVRSVMFEMRWAQHDRDAVVALDMACYSDLVSLDEAAGLAETLSAWRGIPRARNAIAHGDENAWSPAESDGRLLWTLDAELPRPLTNRPVFDLTGRHLRTPDLLDAGAGVAAEYDGVVHLDRRLRRRDVERDETYRAIGMEEVVLTAEDLIDRDRAVHRLRQAYARAASRPATDRAWTAQPPTWWRGTATVAQRRALSGRDRDRFLRYRDAA